MSRNSGEIDTNSTTVLTLGHCEFDLRQKELRDRGGASVPLRAQSAEVLLILSQNPNSIVGKGQLIDQVWHGVSVTDDSLVQCIADIRRALGKPAYEIIETFPKKGYRLNVIALKQNQDKAQPAIAVLPFVNLSDAPGQEYFADGMTEDVIAGLSRFRSVFVVARNLSFSDKSKPPDLSQITGQPGVKYIFKGTVRVMDNKIRITGQLTDAPTGNHLWAEQYNCDFKKIFTVQDEITEKIVATIAPEIDYLERQRAQSQVPENLGVWGRYQRALTAHQSAMGDECTSVVREFDKVCELDPEFAPGFAMAASSRVRYALLFEPENRDELLNEALEKARRGITLDPRDSTCLWAYGRALSLLGQHDEAISSTKEAVSLNPNDSLAHHYLAIALGSAGRLEEAVLQLDHAIRLSPHDVPGGGFRTYRAFLMFDLERYEEALECAQRSVREPYPLSIPFELMTAALIRLNRPEEARTALKKLLEHTPETSLRKLSNRPWIGRPETKARFLDALSEAGLPK